MRKAVEENVGAIVKSLESDRRTICLDILKMLDIMSKDGLPRNAATKIKKAAIQAALRFYSTRAQEADGKDKFYLLCLEHAKDMENLGKVRTAAKKAADAYAVNYHGLKPVAS